MKQLVKKFIGAALNRIIPQKTDKELAAEAAATFEGLLNKENPSEALYNHIYEEHHRAYQDLDLLWHLDNQEHIDLLQRVLMTKSSILAITDRNEHRTALLMLNLIEPDKRETAYPLHKDVIHAIASDGNYDNSIEGMIKALPNEVIEYLTDGYRSDTPLTMLLGPEIDPMYKETYPTLE